MSFRFAALFTLALGLASCSSVVEIDAQYAPTNKSNLHEAVNATMKSFRLTPVEAKLIGEVYESNGYERAVPITENPPPPKVPFAVGSTSAGGLEQSEAGAFVRLTAHSCMIGSGCGCDRQMEYFFAQGKDGAIWVLVPTPKEEVHTSFHFGSCSFGCGVPSPPSPMFLYELPTTDIKKVRSVDVPFEYHVGRESCTNPMPAP